jgi:hypothetical protein
MEIEHAPVPEQAPDHPANVDPAAGFSVKVTVVPLLKFEPQAPGQLMPAGLLMMVPLPDPATVTLSGKVLLTLDSFR